MITKKFWVDFDSYASALTLSPSDLWEHDDWWKVEWKVMEDYFEWVNYFTAEHPVYWKVWWDFEQEVYADTEEWYNDFYSKHKPYAWDYMDI